MSDGVMSREDAYNQIREELISVFEVPAEKVSPDARLSDDLGLDSIDAVDIMVELQEKTGKRVSPEQFEKVVVVDDLVTLVLDLYA